MHSLTLLIVMSFLHRFHIDKYSTKAFCLFINEYRLKILDKNIGVVYLSEGSLIKMFYWNQNFLNK